MQLGKRNEDFYQMSTASYEELLADVKEIEANSEWIRAIPTDKITVLGGLGSPLEAEELGAKYGIDYMNMYELLLDGTKLVAKIDDRHFPVRECAVGGLSTRAKVWGSSLRKLESAELSMVFNVCLRTQTGSTMVLKTYDRATAFHSESQYEIMPISELLEIARGGIAKNHNSAVMTRGYNSHSYTSATWVMNDERITDAYSKAIARHNAKIEVENLIPTIIFSTSNTADSSARLVPAFTTHGGLVIRLADSIEIAHRTNQGGMDAFEKAVNERMYATFLSSINTVKNLAETSLRHAPNAVVGICKKLGIAARYGDVAREQVCDWTADGTYPVSAHDCYYAIAEAIESAENLNELQKTRLGDTLARAILMDWRNFDVGGVVSWS